LKQRFVRILIALPAALVLALASACGERAEKASGDKDLVNFRLPEAVRAAAPQMQEHLFQLLPYNTARFPIKPEFVLLEEGAPPVKGRLNPAVVRMNLLHLAYYRDGELIWSGSLLNGLHRGVQVVGQKGYDISFTSIPAMAAFHFVDGDTAFRVQFPRDVDYARWLERDGAKLYLNHYVFPEALVRGNLQR